MMQRNSVNALRQTHSAVKTLIPFITAGLTVTGALIAAMEARNADVSAAEAANTTFGPSGPTAPDANPTGVTTPLTESATSANATLRRLRPIRRVSVRSYIATLVVRLLLVVLGIAIVLALAFAATSIGKVGEAVTITALVLLTLYLVEKVARQN
jgi:hypothetical protein